MANATVLRLAGICSLLSVMGIIATIALALGSGRGGPVPLDFGSAASLRSMQEPGSHAALISLLALISPTLSLPAGLGWLRLLGGQSACVLVGVVLWYLGMIFVIWQDALEYVLVAHLPAAYSAADDSAGAALLAMGNLLGRTIEVFTILGDLVSFGGLVLVAAVLWQQGGSWRILAAAGIAGSVLICLGLLVPSLAIARLPGFILFMGWMAAMGMVMLHGRTSGQMSDG